MIGQNVKHYWPIYPKKVMLRGLTFFDFYRG